MITDPSTSLAPFAPAVRTLVVGGGVAGLACARRLAAAGERVVVLDKGRGPGGRASTRRIDADDLTIDGADDLTVDHGAQYFTARGDGFRRAVATWEGAGVVAPWRPRLVTIDGPGSTPRPTEPSDTLWVGTPTMSSLVRHLSTDRATAPLDDSVGGLEVRYGVRVTRLERAAGGWRVEARAGDGGPSTLGPVERLILAAPTPQTVELLATVEPAGADTTDLADRLRRVSFDPCWAILAVPMLEADLGASFGAPFDAAFVEGSPLGWIADNASKPGRASAPAWTLHATPAWSRDHLESDRTLVAPALLEALSELVGRSLEMRVLQAHRWRHARVDRSLVDRSLVDRSLVDRVDDVDPFVWRTGLALGVCGDGCAGPRIEAAWTSGDALGRRLVGDSA